MTVEEAILSHDMEDIINRMILYAKEKIKLLDIKNLQGKEPFDFVQDILCKSLESKRNWDETKCSFVEFLFGCLKSEISNFYSSKQIFHQDIPDNLSEKNESVDEEIQEIYRADRSLAYLCFCHRGVFPAAQYGNQRYGEVCYRNRFVCHRACTVAGAP